MIHLCDERDLQVATATIKALLDTKQTENHLHFGG